jgi:hypothetical protein
MSAKNVPVEVSKTINDAGITRRQILIALGVCASAEPLLGCGGGSSQSAAAAPPSSVTPPTPTPPTPTPPTPTPPTPPPAPPPLDITPTATLSDTSAAALVSNFAYLESTSMTNPAFTFTGAASSLITQFGTVLPRKTMVSADTAVSDTFTPGRMYATFYHTGKTLDVIQYGFGDSVTLYINDEFTARYGIALVSGTAQGGSTTSLILSSTSSSTSGYYNQYYVRITGGTGVLNEARQITAYDSATFTATVDSPWTTTPDNTTQYIVQDGTQPFVLDQLTGSVKYLHLNWEQSGQRKITIEQGIFAGVASDGTIAAALPWSATPLLVVGDSFWEGEAAPSNVPRLIDTFSLGMKWLPTNLGAGGTGYLARSLSRLNFQDRIAPPAEAWRVLHTATAGTYTIGITLGGTTSSTDPLAFDADAAAIESALNLLSNVITAAGSFSVARGDISTPFIIVGHGVSGATLSFDTSALTGGTVDILGAYVGDVAPNVPKDSSGSPMPFYLLVPASGTDNASTDAQVQAAATYVAQQIGTLFPTAMPIFTGVFGDCNAGTSVIGPADVSRNAAIAAAAATLPMIGGKVPFIDTYANGLGGLKIINGLGTVANPQAGTNSNLKSIVSPGHPTGAGSQFMADWLVTQVQALIK